MNLRVISDDRALVALCRELAAEFAEVGVEVIAQTNALQDQRADLILWDYQRTVEVPPQDLKWGTTCFALVEYRDLNSFRSAYAYAEVGIVLKPVNRSVLRTVLAHTISSVRAEANEVSIRNDRDDLLQHVMEANLRLQQYDAERSNFLSRALHDFHAPLTALSGYCGLLLGGHIGPLNEEHKLIVRRMHNSVTRLSRMTSGMFQLSVGARVSVEPILREVDIAECIEQSLHEIEQLAREKSLQLDVDLEPLSTPLQLDSSQIEQVMVNLLENACKFSPRGGSITVKGYSCFTERRSTRISPVPESERRTIDSKESNTYRVDVVDCGPGISPDQLRSIFEEYVSYAGGHDRTRGGLGLAICRMILNRHKGRIWAENTRSGARFSFVLPLKVSVSAAKYVTADGAVYNTQSLAACV